MRKSYPGDITLEQFEKICPELENLKKVTSWRAIPHDFPKWQNVRCHYDIWTQPDENGVCVLDRILRKLAEEGRKKENRKEKTTMIIIDSKSIQNTDTAKEKGYDAWKKIWYKAAYWC